MNYVTYEDLFLLMSVIVAIIGLIVAIFNNKLYNKINKNTEDFIMKFTGKKILSLFLAILMIFSTSAYAFAADTTESVTGFTDEDAGLAETGDHVSCIGGSLYITN